MDEYQRDELRGQPSGHATYARVRGRHILHHV